MSNPKLITYVLDTNILINFALFVPIKLNEVFWAKMAERLAEGKWILLDVVVTEVKFNQDLIDWCKAQAEAGVVQKVEDRHRFRAVEINNTYPMIDQVAQKSEADTYIIAYAENKKMCVFTRESFKDPTKIGALNKIPDVCKALRVRYERTPEKFLTDLGF